MKADAAKRRKSGSLRLLGHVVDGELWEWDAQKESLWVSDRLLKTFGYLRTDLQDDLQFRTPYIHPEDAHNIVSSLARFIDDRTDTIELHYRLRRKDGSYATVHDRCFATRGKGKVLTVGGTIQDISNRIQAEEELLRLTRAVHLASDPICILDRTGRPAFHNQAFTELTGYAPDELHQAGGVRAIFVDGATATHGLETLEREGKWEQSVMIRNRDEQVLEASLRASTVVDKAGATAGVIIVSSDRREEKEAQRKMAEQAAILDQSKDAILVQDLTGRVQYWNKSAEEVFGWSSQEMIGQQAQDLMYHDVQIFEGAMEALLRDGAWSGEVTKLTRDGQEVLVEERWSLLRNGTGEPESILAINTDITERKKFETKFLRAQRLDSIGALAGGIAHDLNNILGPIVMAVDLFKIKFTDQNDLELLETVEVSARRGVEMVRQVLSFARGIEGRKSLIHPLRLLKEVAKIATETFPKSISVTTTLPDDIWTVPGDSTQLGQVLLNLCVNSRDAMPDGGQLTLSASNIEIDAQFVATHRESRPGSYVLFAVSDTGHGMPQEVIDKIFEPFFSTKEPGKGTGLGLSTSLSIVQSHGGFIITESAPHRGTTFQVFLPARAGESPAAPVSEVRETPRGNGETILVIDDEPSVRKITRQTLEAFGYKALVACDGAEGVATYARHGSQIAAVITDMMMPVMDGAATIRALMGINPGVRIIAASGLVSKGAEAEAAGAGVKHFLPKPYTAATILRALHTILHPEASK